MAHISNVQLSVGRAGPSTEFAEVSFDVQFYPLELQWNPKYRLNVWLMEEDEGALDACVLHPNGLGAANFWRIPNPPGSKPDDFIGQISTEIMQPEGQENHHVTRRREWKFGAQESGKERYRAFVWLIPSFSDAVALSNRVDVKVG